MPKFLNNFGEILDEVLSHLDLRQIDLTKIYEIDKSSISNDRPRMLTRRKMMKYRAFMKEFGISENFMLRGIYPILAKDVEIYEEAQRIINEQKLKIDKLESLILEKSDHISTLKEALRLCREGQ